MRDYIIMTDSCCDLPLEYIKKYNLCFAKLTCSYDGNEYVDDFGQSLDYKKFFDDMRKGAMPKTSQPSVNEFYSIFKEAVEEGKEVVYICVSTGMSGTENSANNAKNMVLDEMPDAKIHIVNILTASLGQGLTVINACEMQKQGASAEDIVKFVEDSRQYLNTYITVDDLHHLKRGGRLSSAAAVLGIVLHIKPIITINEEGRVMPILKVKGRKSSISKLAEIVAKRIENPEEQVIAISHGDCLEEALKLKESILKLVKVKDVLMNYTGPATGTYGGPGNIAVFFMGKHRQTHMIDI